MFFDPNEVNGILNCKKCNERLDVPHLLPCGNSICSFCVSSIQKVKNKEEFQCLICKDKHKMDKNGLPINLGLKELLSIKPIDVSRGKYFDTLQVTLKKLLNKRNILKNRLDNRTDYVKEHCIDLRNEVQLATEEAIQLINKYNEEMIAEIDEYEKELIEFNQKSTQSMNKFQQLIDDLDRFNLNTSQYLNGNNLNDEKLIEFNKEAMNIKALTELEIANLREVILNDSLMSFDSNKNKIEQSILGEMKITKVVNMDSVILLNNKQINELMLICEFSLEQKWNLIYRASRDGFEIANFHAKCDNKPNTFIVIKSENGNVFGGYTKKLWNITDSFIYKFDSNAFIFSFINLKSQPLKIKIHNSKLRAAIGSKNTCLFQFGVFDFEIVDKSNTNSDSYSNLGHSYIHPNYVKNSDEAKSFLAGSQLFKVTEIEVYTQK